MHGLKSLELYLKSEEPEETEEDRQQHQAYMNQIAKAGHKFIRKWRDADGSWHYEYQDKNGGIKRLTSLKTGPTRFPNAKKKKFGKGAEGEVVMKGEGIEHLGFYIEKAEKKPELAPGGHRTPPKEYRKEGASERSDYADPKNYKYPLHSESNVRAAISYFSKPKNASVYPVKEQKAIWGRIKRAAKKYKIELGEESGPPSVEKAELTPAKARQILHDKEVRGKPLTEQQRKYFGAVASGTARKSMDGIDLLEEYLAKGMGRTVGQTVTSGAQPGLGNETGAISGDNAAGADGLPHGETKFNQQSAEDGGPLAEKGKQHSKQGPVQYPAKEMPKTTNQFSEDDEQPENQMKSQPAPAGQRGGSKKMMSHQKSMTPSAMLDQTAHERAQLASHLQKGDDITVITKSAPKEAPEPELEKAQVFRHGDCVYYSNESDLAAERLLKSDSFYVGGPPSITDKRKLSLQKSCTNGHAMPAMLTSCPTCGVGGPAHVSSSAGQDVTFAKSGRGLSPRYEADLYLPNGTESQEE